MDSDEFKELLRAFSLVVIAVISGVSLIFGAFKLGGYLFDISDNMDSKSLQICKEKGGTPVLEDHGTSYKSCAINGQSNTKNVVK